jgi:hypothetical protein
MIRKTRKDPATTVSSEEALAFVQKLQKAFPKTPRSKAEQERLRDYLAKFDAEVLRSVGRRVLMDILKRPARTVPLDYVPPADTAVEPGAEKGRTSAPNDRSKSGRPRTRAAKSTAVSRSKTLRRR